MLLLLFYCYSWLPSYYDTKKLSMQDYPELGSRSILTFYQTA